MHLLHRLATTSQLLVAASAINLPLTARDDSAQTADIPLVGRVYGARFNAITTLGDQEVELLVDTGSSDLFVVEENFECYYQGREVAQSTCGWDDTKLYEPTDTLQYIPNEYFVATYGAGQAQGNMGYEDVTLGGITVNQQKIAVVNITEPMMIGNSGVLGLAYRIITQAYESGPNDPNPQMFTASEQEPYDPLFVNMYRQNLTNPYFSLALNRLPANQESGDGGYMTLGGLPPVDVSSDWITVPVQYFDGQEITTAAGKRVRSYWATTVESIIYGSGGSRSYTNDFQVIVDSGAPLNLLPEDLADRINNAFSPRAVYSSTYGGYLVDCDAVPPSLTVTLGGHEFALNPIDLIAESGEPGVCISTISRGLSIEVGGVETPVMHILGVPFLKSVVTVFDFGNSQMRFAERADYSASADIPSGGSIHLTATAGTKLFILSALTYLFGALF